MTCLNQPRRWQHAHRLHHHSQEWSFSLSFYLLVDINNRVFYCVSALDRADKE